METHNVPRRIVKDETEEVEFDNQVEARGKVVEKRGKIALLGDGLADFQQGFELTPGVFERGGEHHFRRRNDGVRHTRQDNTRVGAGSTAGVPTPAQALSGSPLSSFRDILGLDSRKRPKANEYRDCYAEDSCNRPRVPDETGPPRDRVFPFEYSTEWAWSGEVQEKRETEQRGRKRDGGSNSPEKKRQKQRQ
jgi:hypothetical protein